MPSYLNSDDLSIKSFGSLDLYHTTNPPTDGVDSNGRLNINLLTIDAMENDFIEKPSSSTTGNIAVFDANSNCVDSGSGVGDFLKYTTTAPTAANTNGIKVCVLSSEPATKYNGWLYIITD